MNQKELNELRRRFRLDKNNFSYIYGCYVNSNREIISWVDASMGLMRQEEQDAVFDVVLFDLPGTLRSEGVVHTISAIDYIFIPLKADNVVMQSSLQFAEVVEEELIARHNCNLKGIYLFWNMVDKRERTESYESWNRVIQKAELHLLESRIPDTKRYNKELSSLKNSIFRSTLFPPDNRQIKGSGLCELIEELCAVTHLDASHTL